MFAVIVVAAILMYIRTEKKTRTPVKQHRTPVKQYRGTCDMIHDIRDDSSVVIKAGTVYNFIGVNGNQCIILRSTDGVGVLVSFEIFNRFFEEVQNV